MNLDSIAQELDRLYEFEISRYIERCDELKKSGFKIYRNSTGQHKVVLTGQGAQSEQKQQNVYDTSTAKKENIFVRAKNRVKRGVETIKTVVKVVKYISDSQNNRRA